jgi:restriction system protein
MLARFDSQFHQRSKLNRTVTKPDILWTVAAIVALLLFLWLVYHYLLQPNWISRLPSFVTEMFFLFEVASGLTLGIVVTLLWWRQRRQTRPPAVLSVKNMVALSPAAFEQYVATLFRQKGYQVKLRGRSGDKGVDLELTRPGGRHAIVQCKRYRHTIGPDIVRELFGTMIHERVHHAFLVTTADISDAARQWAKHKPMTLIDGATLVDIASTLYSRSIS